VYRWWLGITIALLSAGALALGVPQRALDEHIAPSGRTAFDAVDFAPPFALPSLDGTEIKLAQFQGRYVLLNFWASYCPACRHEMPTLETVRRERGLPVLGVNTGEVSSIVRPFLDQVGVAYPNVIDKTGAVSVAYRVHSLPATFLIDPRGRILWKYLGFVSASRLASALEEIASKGDSP